MTQCVLTDSNPAIPLAPPIGNLPAKFDGVVFSTPPLECVQVVRGEPDTATVTCVSVESGVTVTDDADLDEGCPTPTATPTNTPTPTPTNTPTATPTNTPTATPVSLGGGCSMTSQCSGQATGIDGVCTGATAAAPAASNTGLLIALALLAGIGGFAIRRRRGLRN